MSIRPRIQRAFLSWLEEVRPLSKRQIVVCRRTRRIVEFNFDVGAPHLHGWLTNHDITVAAFQAGEIWDLILDLDCWPVRVGHGVVCRECLAQCQRVFATREELWRDHLFDPLLKWMKTELEAATAIALRDFDGLRDAKLVRAEARDQHTVATIKL